ncbi:Gfo/Idh/MocA family oxidoreductase [Luteolibacter ambystomatis]|uniref:Gfo/Idh/MocA family oxidoreductase n=1 Tax=Luteolibacter ambystomatis TaxID=2824561 RepID=A0A975IZP2_9BACT|nr:Gfo/Idh/MocA family oxidoreductase [Luteolibacter ambystomatis]QUE51542.1 Gfo/Idh/MocA family oxidoreductase [Luteolibacter ambystomatis]
MTQPLILPNRRTFLQTGALAAAASTLPSSLFAQVGGSDEIKVALIGCGGRGTGAAAQTLTVPGTRLVAMADAFPDRLEGSLGELKKQFGERADVPKERQFTGFEAFKQAIDSADVVLLCTPPGFRPSHFEYAIEKGKHVFMEKPVAVDGTGIRKMLEAAKKADEKKLKVVCGLQRRYQTSYLETFKKVQEGAIGDFISSQVYWTGGGVWVNSRQPGSTEMQYQMRNWYYFNWLCGDHIAEQHVHNLDVGNWFKGAHPAKCVGMGGRSQRIGKDYGEIFDHFYVEYTYPDGTIMNSQCRHWGGWTKVTEEISGTKGTALPGMIKDHSGKIVWRFRETEKNPYQNEHDALYDHIRNDKPLNNAFYTAESTLTAIMGRMAAYSGEEITWEKALNSQLDTMPKVLAWDADPGPKAGPDGLYPAPVPGKGKYV